jgi:SAM-dependent MidA family methyltransferase
LKNASILAIDFYVKLRACFNKKASDCKPMNEVTEIIRREIAETGPISFARFMELALYEPSHGYYEREAQQIGRGGDYYTSVSVGSLFGELLAFQCALWLDDLSGSQPPGCFEKPLPLASDHTLKSAPPDGFQILETGAHRGQLARDILSWFRQRRPELWERLTYWIIEPSARRQQWQRETLADLGARVQWAGRWEELPHGIRGVILSNELLDAFPLHRLGWDAIAKRWFAWGVEWTGQHFGWVKLKCQPQPNVLDGLAACSQTAVQLLEVLPDGFSTEVCPAAQTWWIQAAAALEQGKLLTIDYGLTAEEFFSPERVAGTVRAYRHHHLSNELLSHAGEQDLTAHVNFTALQIAGEQAGLQTQPLITQAQFLTRIAERTWKADANFGEWTAERRRRFQTLTHPEHLGRPFKVLIQSR